jgi:hypothetical protein
LPTRDAAGSKVPEGTLVWQNPFREKAEIAREKTRIFLKNTLEYSEDAMAVFKRSQLSLSGKLFALVLASFAMSGGSPLSFIVLYLIGSDSVKNPRNARLVFLAGGPGREAHLEETQTFIKKTNQLRL